MHRIRPLAALAFALFAAPAIALPCAGFRDVEDTDSFCSAVQWLRSRAVTNGCTTTTTAPPPR